MLEIRFHGRGGQGAVTAAELLVGAALRDGLQGQAIPLFGAERRGAPVVAYARIGKDIKVRSGIREPDVVVVLDSALIRLVDVYAGLKKNGIVLINSSKSEDIKLPEGVKGYAVDASKIAVSHGLVLSGWPLVNTPILGALVKVTGVVSLNSLIEEIKARLPKGELNAKAAVEAYEEVSLIG